MRSYPQPLFSRAMRATRASTSGETLGRPGYFRFREPSNFFATSLRYHASMVSGFATLATTPSALRPTRFPISARVTRSASLSRNLDGSFERIEGPGMEEHLQFGPQADVVERLRVA